MPIIKISQPQGWLPDLTPEEIPEGAYSRIENMRFTNGYAQRFNGIAPVFAAPTVAPRWLAPYETSTTRYFIHAGTDRVFADDGATRTEITPASTFTGAIDDRWTGGVLGGIFFANNGVDQPQFWNGNTATDLANLPGWNATWRCQSMVAYKNYLVALNITKGANRFPHMVKWSDAAVPGALPASWDEANLALDAGEQDLAETTDSLVDALPLGDDLIIYKERSAYRMSFVGQPLIFRFERIRGDSGMLTRGCAVQTPLGHVVLTAGDVVLMTPSGPQSIADGKVRRFIFDSITTTNFRRAFVCTNPQRFEVLVCFPFDNSTECSAACVWNWQTQEWGFRRLENVTFGASGQAPSALAADAWSADTGAWQDDITNWPQALYAPNEARLLMCSTTSILGFDSSNADQSGAAVSGLVERSGLTFGDAYTNKLLRAVYPRVDAPSGTVLTVQVGAAMVPDQAPTWSDPVQITVGSDQKADCFALGRYLAFRVSASRPWRMRSLDLDVESSGAY